MRANYRTALKRGNQLAINQRLDFNLTRYFAKSFAAATRNLKPRVTFEKL